MKYINTILFLIFIIPDTSFSNNSQEYKLYIENSQICKLSSVNNIFLQKKNELIQCGIKFQNLKGKDFFNATEECRLRKLQMWQNDLEKDN
jgi:hypothetical protein